MSQQTKVWFDNHAGFYFFRCKAGSFLCHHIASNTENPFALVLATGMGKMTLIKKARRGRDSSWIFHHCSNPLEMGQMDLFVDFTFTWEPFWKVASSVWENRTLLWPPVWCLRFPLHHLHLQPLCCRHLLRLRLLILKLLNILITNKSSKMYEIDQIYELRR